MPKMSYFYRKIAKIAQRWQGHRQKNFQRAIGKEDRKIALLSLFQGEEGNGKKYRKKAKKH